MNLAKAVPRSSAEETVGTTIDPSLKFRTSVNVLYHRAGIEVFAGWPGWFPIATGEFRLSNETLNF